MNRRQLLRCCLGAGALTAARRLTSKANAANHAKRRFTIDLCPGRIGVDADQRQAIDYAAAHGFESVEPYGSFLANLSPDEVGELQQVMTDKRVVWGAAGLSVQFRQDNRVFEEGLKALPPIASGLSRAGVSRVGTWLSPGHDELTYMANFKQHAHRLKGIARVLSDHGLRFGLEYVGPKTSWTSRRFAFIHTMAETRELIAEIGAGNVGLVLDSWHWYTAGEGLDDLATLVNDDVVAVDLNDAPRGVERDEQIDNRRELPMATGVIDLAGFMKALAAMGYDGPIRAEPFNRKLNAMDNSAALQATAQAMQQAFALIG